MAGFVVFICLVSNFISGLFVRPIAERLILGKAAHTDPYGFFLRLYLQWTLVRFCNLPHDNLS
jgi:hypothetical protein